LDKFILVISIKCLTGLDFTVKFPLYRARVDDIQLRICDYTLKAEQTKKNVPTASYEIQRTTWHKPFQQF
jgi:hypothetical protein